DVVRVAVAPLGQAFSGEVSLGISDTDPTGPYSAVSYSAPDLACTSYTVKVQFKKTGIADPLCTVMEAVQIYRNLDTTKTIQLETTDFRSPPAAPLTPAATDLELNQIQIAWDDTAVKTEIGYRVQRHLSSDYSDAEPVTYTISEANQAQYIDTSLAVLTDYYYRVAAYNAYGKSAWTNVTGPAQATKVAIGDRTVSNMTDLSALEHVTKITGYLNIQSGGSLSSSDLSLLSSLRTIGGGLHVQSTSTLTDLAGLSGLESAAFIYIYLNSALTSLNGLQGLDSVPGYVHVFNNGELTSLTGLDNLLTIGTAGDGQPDFLRIHNNDKLPSLTGLESLAAVRGYVEISDNQLMTSLVGLESLEVIGDAESVADDNLRINDNPNLGSLSNGTTSGLIALDDIKGHLFICSNTWLTDIKLPALSTVGAWLEIRGNQNLGAISDMLQLTSVGTYLKIGCTNWIDGNTNPVLSNLSGLANLRSIGTDFAIYNTSAASMTFTSLQTIGGRLWLNQNNELTSLMLPALASAGGPEFGLYENAKLANVYMPLLSSVGGYMHLRNLDGAGLQIAMDELDTVADFLCIEGCDHLIDLSMDDLYTVGLDADTGGDYLRITGNPELATISFP
ncbi:MAG: fibronectin type III domain-containing protein, partial [Spirochaetaceae bacterium]|nr:fibronectin type III domain-containing protein [Spirochaetaceae bacterium]